MPADDLARAEANFAAAKELCGTGHSDAEGTTCTYGGMSSANGYWLASEDCERSHGEFCDLRAVCDGAETETGFRGREGAFLVDDWIWRVTACQPCAELYVSAHPEWKRPDPDEPKHTYDEIMTRLHEEVEADRAAMSPAEREASDMVTNMLLYGQHPAPPNGPTKFAGFGGLLDDAVALTPLVKPVRDRPVPQFDPPAYGYLLPPAGSPEGTAMWNEMLYGAPTPEPPAGSTATGLFDALGGVVPGARPDPTEAVMNAIVAGEVRAGRPVAGSTWAPVGCTCPWPWPMGDGRHILASCPHYEPPPKPVVGRNPQIGCRKVDASWIHGRPHDCPIHARGAR